MSKKIYLSPSNQDENYYAVGNTCEMEQCNRIADATKTALERCGFEVKKAEKGQSMKVSINESNLWGADLHLPIHTNAATNGKNGTAGGTIVFVYSTTTERMKIAVPIYKAVQAVTPGKTEYGVRTYPAPGLAELNNTNALAVYIEVDFHDNPAIAEWLIENPVTVGEAIAKGVCEGYGVEYVAPAQSDAFYRVQVGAYNDKVLAENLLAQLKKAGFEKAFIVEVKK